MAAVVAPGTMCGDHGVAGRDGRSGGKSTVHPSGALASAAAGIDRSSRLALQEKLLYGLLGLLLTACIVVGLVVQGPASTLEGFVRIQHHPARLLNDFTLVGGEGAALVNAAITALLGLLLVRLNQVRLSGPTLSAIFTILGFGLFGKTPLNVLPIFLGVGISARIARKSFRTYILMALFGTTLGPLITALAVEAGLPTPIALIAACAGGVAAGILLPPVAMVMLRLHQGFSLYNIGLTGGFIGVFGASLLVASGRKPSPVLSWNDAPSIYLSDLRVMSRFQPLSDILTSR